MITACEERFEAAAGSYAVFTTLWGSQVLAGSLEDRQFEWRRNLLREVRESRLIKFISNIV